MIEPVLDIGRCVEYVTGTMTPADSLVLLPPPRSIRFTGDDRGASSTAVPRVIIDSSVDLPAQGYRLRIDAETGVTIEAPDGAGAFYAEQMLVQMRRQSGATLPGCVVDDWPDYPSRGVMLDISRDKVPTMETLRDLVDQLAEWKVNHLELYTEHTFAYQNHQTVWADASPLTAEEIRDLDGYCRDRFIELVPNQNSFGHFERWLKHDRYGPLAADGKTRSCLDPTNPASLALLEELYDELLPNFSSRQFNVGCDETWDVAGRVYLDFLLEIHRRVAQRDRSMLFWGDIVLQHPDWVAELPRDVVVLAWGYEAAHPFDEHGAIFARSGLPFYVCPGTSSWNSIAGRTDNCVANLRSAAVNGHRHGAIGFLNTDWGDNGHWQYLPVSFLGFAFGAAVSWCAETNDSATASLLAALDRHVFRDEAGVMGRLVYDLGNASVELDAIAGGANSTSLFHLFRADRSHPLFEILQPDEVRAARDRVEAAIRPLDGARMTRPDAALIQAELRNAARMLRHGCDRFLGADPAGLQTDRAAIAEEHRRLWLARNRAGGLEDSVAKMTVRD